MATKKKTKAEQKRQAELNEQGRRMANAAYQYEQNLKNRNAIQYAKSQGVTSTGTNDFIANTTAKEIENIKTRGTKASAARKADELLKKKSNAIRTTNERSKTISDAVGGSFSRKATPNGMNSGSLMTQASAYDRIMKNVQDIQGIQTRKNLEGLSNPTDMQPSKPQTAQTTGPVGMSVSQALAGAKPKTESTQPKANAISGAAKTNVGNPQKTQETQPQTTAPMQNKGTLYAPKDPGAGGGVVQQMGYADDMQKTKDNALLMGYNRPEWKDVTGSAQYARDLQRAGYYDDTDDYRNWTDKKLADELAAEKVKEEAYLNELAENPQATMKAWNDKLYNLTNEQKKYEKIANVGIEDPMRGGTITRRPDDYDTWQYLGNSGEATYMPSYYDSLIYDAIHGENAYADLYENGTDEEIDQAEIEIEDLWDRLENGGFMEMAEDPELAKEIAQTKALTDRKGMSRRRKELEDEQSRRDTIKELTARAKGMEHKDTQLFKSVVQPENTSGLQERTPEEMAKAATELGTRFFVETAFNGDSTDKSYYYATQDPMALKYNPYVAEPEHFMTPEEKETFTLLYENDMKAEAQAFLDAIRTDLTARRRDFLQQTNIENASGEWGAVYGAGTVVENLLHGPEGTLNSIKALLGDKRAQDKNDPSWDAQHYVQEVRGIRGEKWTEAVQGAVTNLGNLFGVDKETVQAAAEKIGQIGGFANQVMYSMLDNAAAYLTTMGMGSSLNFDMTSKFAEGMMQFIMSSEATASTMAEQLDNGKQPWEAAVMAIGSGLIEAATEKWSFEAFMDMDAEKIMKGVQEAWKYIGKNFLAEGSEEFTGFLGEQLMDQIVSTLAGHKSEIQARFEELGGDNEAFKKVLLEYAGKAATDFLAGGFAGAGQSSLNVARYGIQSYITGRNVSHAEANVKGENGITQAVSIAMGMKEGSESRKMAEGIQAKIDAGKNVSNLELGNLANMMYKESGASMVQATAVDIVKKQAQDELKELGMKNPEMTAEAIAKQIVTGEVSKTEHMLISNSGAALQVLKNFMTNPEKLNEAVKTGIKEAGSVRQVIQNVVSGKARSSAAEGLVNSAYRNASIADKATAAMAKGKRTGATDAVRDGQVVQIKNIQFDTKKETDADGNKSILDDSKVTIQTENGEETVSLDDIQAMDKDTGALLEFIKTNKGIISEQFANTVLGQIAQGKGKQQAGNILDSAMKIRLAAYTESAMPRTDLDSATAEALWNDSRNEFEAEEKKRTEVRTTIKENQGSLTFEGAEFGTKRWEEKLKRSGLTRAQRDEANTLGEIAKRLGFNVKLINDTENDAIFGWEDRNTGTVTINLAGRDENGRSHSILTAAAHEFTHWIEQNSPNEYAKLRGYVIEQLKSQGKDVTSMLMDKVANYELYDQDINLSGAMAEMVADACDGIFGSQEMANKLKEINPTLFGKMKEFVSNWIAKVRAVINNMTGSASYESRALEQQVEEIAKIWLGAREEAMGAEATPAAEAQAEETQKSVRQRDTAYMEAVENGDEETERRIVDEAAKEAGYEYKGYHGTNAKFTVFDPKKLGSKNWMAGSAYLGFFASKSKETAESYTGLNSMDQLSLHLNSESSQKMEQIKKEHDFEKVNSEYEKARENFEKEYKRNHGYEEEVESKIEMIKSNEFINQMTEENKKSFIDNMRINFEYDWNTKNLSNMIKAWEESDEAKKYQEYTNELYKEWEQYEIKRKGYTPNVMNLYIKMENPFVYDFKGEERDADSFAARMAYAKDNGYDGCIFKNVADGADIDDIYAVFSNTQFKSADPVTYDDNGKVIPPSERFNTTKPDIRYSIRKDSQGRILSAEQQEFFKNSKAVDKNGNLKVVYHGTEDAGFTVFNKTDDIGYFFTDDDEVASSYSDTLEKFAPKKAKNWDDVNEVAKRFDMEFKKMDDGYYHLVEKHFSGTMRGESYEIVIDDQFDENDYQTAMKWMLDEEKNQRGGKADYEVYLNLENPLIIEGRGNVWAGVADHTGRKLYTWEELTEEQKKAIAEEYKYDLQEAESRGYSEDGYELDVFDPINLEIIEPMSTREWVRKAVDEGYDGVIFRDIIDEGYYGGYTRTSDVYVALRPEQIKSVNNTEPTKNPDIRYSVKQGEQPQEIRNDEGEPVATILPGNTIAETQFSLRSYYDDDERGKMIKAMKKAGYTKEQAENWMKSLDNIAKIMIADRMRYDFTADRSKTFLKENGDVYKKTLDASTMCKKTRLYNGTFNLVQHMLPNTILMPEDLIDLYNMMKEMDLETPCGMCYVQSRRRLLGPYTEEWLKEYKGEYIPTVDEVTTSDGLEKLKKEHPQAYTDFVDAMNSKGVNNPKLVQQRTDYRGDIRNLRKSTIDYLNKIGGLRIQSFSDFEVVHMLDLMQAVMDMKAKGLSAQAYTKVPEFAKIYGPTGIKINVSVLGSGVGVDHHGNLVMDNDEGMNWDTARELREMYPEDVGTIIVGINDEHIIAAMGNGEIDFIIPFHKSGWSKAELEKMKTLKHYKDYTDYQNEYMIQGKDADGKLITKKAESNIDPLSYWKFELSGEENAKIYLAECAKNKLIPKFSNFLVDKGDGTFSLPQGKDQRSTNIREGYWKTLIDFKMYENDAYGRTLKDGTKTKVKGAPQKKVTPNFNMDAAMEILENYDGSHRTLPESEDAAKKFVKEYKKNHPLDDVRKQYSVRSPESHDVERWMAALNADSLESEAEKKLLREFQGLKMQQDLNQLKQTELKNEIAKIEALRKAPELTDEEKSMLADLKKRYDKTHHLPAAEFRMMKMLQQKTQSREATAEEKSTLSRLRNLLINAQKKGEAIAEQMYDVTGAEGFASMMYRQHKFIDDEIGDKTREELHETVERMNREAEEIRKELEKTTTELARLEGNAAVQNVKAKLNKAKLHEMAKVVRDQFGTSMSYNELEAAMAGIALKRHAGESIEEDVERLAQRVAETIRYGENETLKALRGLTITIGPGQMAELKGQNSSLNEIRSRLKGTGIKIKQGEYSSLDTDAEDLHRQFTDMPDLGDEKDSLENFVRWVEGLQRNNNAAQQYGLDMDEVRNVVRATSMLITAAEDTQATRNELMDAIRELRTNAEKATARMNAIMKNIEKMIKAGKQAQGLSGVLQSDVAMTINYYNRIAKLAQETAKEKTLRETIIQLKSEAAEAIAKSNEEWRNLIERDRKARETNEKIKTNRNEISRAAKGLYKLWEQPKGLKNVPEDLQPLVREAVKLLALNDLADNGMRFLKADPERLAEIVKKLRRAEVRDGGVNFNYFNMADNNTNPGLFRAEEAVMVLPDLIRQWNTPKKGKNKLDTLEMRLDVAKRINECITDIQNVVRAAQNVNTMQHETTIANMADLVLSDTYTDELDENGKPKSRYFREMTSKVGKALAGLHKAIVSGNMTPEYFFRTLGNRGLSELWDGYHEAENRNGLELRKAQERIAQIAEKNGYAGWDTKEQHEIKLENGETVSLTTGQLMSLYATWKREKTVNPEMSMHLRDGGFYAEDQSKAEGILGRKENRKRAHLFSDADAQAVQDALTKEQIQFVDDMVAYMSSDLAALGNEASMAAYGIKLYKEDYYFPMKMWDGVKNKKSNEAGSAAAEIDRAFHQSFTKARKNNANSALMIGDFMETVADHVSGMINFATMGLMNENLQKVLNYKIEEFTPNSPMGEAVTVDEETGEQEGGGGNTVKRNVRAKLEEAYGREAMDYLNELKKQLNGGAVRTEKSLGDKAISMFRKNAVAGSMSVAFQQPLSYLRAAMLINPKYLMKGIGSEYWKGSYEERLANSGVSVIKDMGRFDMNFGQSAREYLMPEGKEGKVKKAWDAITDKATILPELMDRWTWNRMWVAVKAEQHDLNPDMDVRSDEFLKKCSDRFNELMRRTQVYDSVLVKSANMRSQHYFMKNLTSFMAEPTLTANVLMDAVRMAKNGEAGGKAMLAKAGAIFVLSAVFQAAVKAAWSSGRSPDEKKTWLENFLNRFGSSLISEGDPLNLIPGYSELVALFKKGEISDDAMGAMGKIISAGWTGIDMLLGKEKDAWRATEDSIGQITQLFTNLPAKNISRDARAVYNWITGGKYANRATSGDVLKWQTVDNLMNADSLIGALNYRLEEAGWQTSTSAYTKRIYGAKKAGNEGMAESMENYLLLGKGAKESSITSGIRSAIKADNSTTAAQKVDYLRGMTGQKDSDIATWVMGEYKDGNIDRSEAEALYKKANPKKTDDDAYWAFEKADQAVKTGETVDSDYFRLYDAMDDNKAADITAAVRELTAHGKKKENVRSTINSHYKEAYLAADSRGKVAIRDAMNKAYKALGYTTADVDKTIQGWTKKK